MEWQSTGAQLPPKWKEALSAHYKDLLGRKGLGRYAWCVAAELLLCLPPEHLRELASKLRNEAETDWDRFADKWEDRASKAIEIAPELRAAVNEGLKATTKPAPARKKRT